MTVGRKQWREQSRGTHASDAGSRPVLGRVLIRLGAGACAAIPPLGW